MFSWAAIIQLVSLRMPNFQFGRSAFALEIALAALTLLGVSWVIYWGHTIRYGAVVTYVGVFVYLLAAVASRVDPRHPNSTVERDARKTGARPSP
jgi:membrane protein implicated in regulation of membrane protease activity